MTNDQVVAVIAAILFAGDGIENRLADVSDALTHDAHDWSGISLEEAVARARDLLEAAKPQATQPEVEGPAGLTPHD